MKKKETQKSSLFTKLLGGDMLKSRMVLNQIPLLMLILVCCLLMVTVRYRVETLNKEKSNLERQVSYLREQRMQMQKQYQESIRISRIDRDLDTIGVGLVAGPPFEIKIRSNKQ